jgi:dihydropteroate synthase
VIERIRAQLPDIPISIDTSKAPVAEAACQAGATWVNDVTSGLGDPEMFSLVAEQQAGLILMHMQGNPKTMQHNPTYHNVIEDIRSFFLHRLEAASNAGVPMNAVLLDPGIGFGKELRHNLELMSGIPELKQLGHPLLLGVSRKRWIGELTGRSVENRLAGSLAGAIACMLRGADMLRVHDVKETRDALLVAHRILHAGGCKD